MLPRGFSIDIELLRVCRKLKAGVLVNPFGDFGEDALQERFIEMGRILQREVQILGKPVGLEIAFLQTGAALEHPAIAQFLVGEDTGERPAERIILFNDMRIEADRRGDIENFALTDHASRLPVQLGGTRSRQRVTSRAHSSAGSSFAWPLVRRALALRPAASLADGARPESRAA